MAPLMLHVFGAFQVTRADGSTARFESDKTGALLVYLAVEADRPHRRDALVGLLWPDEPEQIARHNLRQALFSLRQTIGDATAQPPFLLVVRDEIQFNTASDFALDAASFDAHLAASASHPHTSLQACAVCALRLRQAVDLYRGRFLQEFFLADSAEFEEWAVARREAWHQRALEALGNLADYHEQHGNLAEARQCAARQLELDPWREPAYRQLMRSFALEGQRGAAVAQYEKCRRVLAEELGVEPSGETRAVYESILAGNLEPEVADGRTPRPEAASLQLPPANLPTSLTPFIGREHELADLGRLLADPACRCLTLVGPGGIGKTRLALETASQIQGTFTHGVYFVPLAPVNTTPLIVPAIADALGFTFGSAGHADPKAQLFSYLRNKRSLLLMDCLEHLLVAPGVEPGIEVLTELLARAPQVKLLITSREAAGLPGEWVFEVQGLPLPKSGGAEGYAQNASVALFLQRARRAHVGFNPTPEDYRAIIRICQLVEGTPLGIELAAAWVRTLTCDEIAGEIAGGMAFLSVSTRDLPVRHRSMRTVFDHSWQLLSEEEQTVLRRLSVLQGGFRREAAEVVAQATLTTLATLVTKSLVRRNSAGRYDLHELIRQFAAEQLAGWPDEQAATLARHGRYYLTFFGQADERLRSPAQRDALAELTAEMSNFRAAWDWAVAQAEFALIEQAVRLLAWFYDIRGWFQEGLATLGRAVNAVEASHRRSPSDATDEMALGHLLTASAFLAYRLAQYERAEAMLERSLEILRPLNGARVLIESVFFLGMLMEVTGNYARALELYAEGVEIGAAIGDQSYTAGCRVCLHGLVAITRIQDIPENAHARLQSAVADCRAVGDPRLTAFGLRRLSESASTFGQHDEARTALEESAALCQSVGDRWGFGSAYRGLGIIAQAQGKHQQAVVMFRKCLDTFTELGGTWWVARVLATMGSSILALGDDAEAERVWHESLRLATETGGTPVALEGLVGIASVRAKRGDIEPALELLLLIWNHPASLQETRNRAEQLRIELEGQLTMRQVEILRAQVRAKTLEGLVDEVLKRANLKGAAWPDHDIMAGYEV